MNTLSAKMLIKELELMGIPTMYDSIQNKVWCINWFIIFDKPIAPIDENIKELAIKIYKEIRKDTTRFFIDIAPGIKEYEGSWAQKRNITLCKILQEKLGHKGTPTRNYKTWNIYFPDVNQEVEITKDCCELWDIIKKVKKV